MRVWASFGHPAQTSVAHALQKMLFGAYFKVCGK
jgi:hypothetical protein